MILHIVLFQAKPSATAEDSAELTAALEAASRQVTSIRNVRVGKAADLGLGYSSWPKDQKAGYVALFEFEDRNGLQAYLSHPTHRRLSDMFKKTSDQSVVFDAEVVDPTLQGVASIIGQTTD
jgi:hypothetical protein